MPRISASGAAACTRSETSAVLLGRLGRRADVERHAADVGLVRDVVREDLHRHGEAELLGGVRRLLGARRDERLDRRDLVGLEDLLRLDLGEDRPTRARGRGEDALHALPVGVEVGQEVGRRLVEERQVLGVVVHVHVGPHGVLGGVERRDVGLPQGLDGVVHRDLAHEGGEERLARVRLRDVDQRGRGLGRVAHRLGREDGQDAVDVAVVHQRRGGVAVAHLVGVSADVDGVAARGEAGEGRLQLGVGLGAQLGELAAEGRGGGPTAMTPGPPALVRMASRGPLGLVCRLSASEASNRSSISSTRTTPARRKAAL